MSSESYSEIEDRIQLALSSIGPDEKPNLLALARGSKVPYWRLRMRYLGRGTRQNCGGAGRSLSDAQELALCQIIEREEADGTHLRHWQVQNRANWILALDNPNVTEPPTVGKNWPSRFLQRHPQFEKRASHPLKNERKWSHDVESLGGWFERFRKAMQDFGIQKQDVWNFDETGFRVGIGGKQLVIVTRYSNAKIFHGDADDREHLTSGEFISAGGRSIPPFVIMKGKLHMEKFYFEGGFDDNTTVAVSDSGYLTNELAIPLLEHFDRETSKGTVGRWRLLLFDGYESHTDYAVLDWCWKHHIVPFTLPPHATHILQPLDVVCFQPFKHYHRQAIDKSLRLGIFDFNRLDFIAAFNEMRTKTFKSSTIISSFAETGLIPYNPEKVLAPLRKRIQQKIQAPVSTPSPPSSSHTESTWPTPQNVAELRKYASNICDTLEYIEGSSPFRRRFDRFMTAAVSRAIAGLEAEQTLREHKQEAQERAKRQSGTKKVVSRGGVMRVGDARQRIGERRKEEVEQAQRRARLKGIGGRRRKALKRELDALALFDDPNRSNPRSERAVSV
jgi:hypothetical protein